MIDKEKEKQYMMTAIMKEFNCFPPMSLPKICEGLVNQGYGNIEIARKEVAKEIIKDIEDRLTALCKLHGKVEEFNIKYIKRSMTETYGVKLDE